MNADLHTGDCVAVLAQLPADSVDAIVTDPPYGLHFMGKAWDRFGTAVGVDHAESDVRSGSMHAGWYDHGRNAEFGAFSETWAREALRVLRPGGHIVVFGGTRTYHWMAVGIERAGFEVRDSLVWLYGQGFPKSLDLGRAMDAALGEEREVIEERVQRRSELSSWQTGSGMYVPGEIAYTRTAPASLLAQHHDGKGTALRPSMEPIVLARRPLEGTTVQNVIRHGTGALNIDEGRLPMSDADRDLFLQGTQAWARRADRQDNGDGPRVAYHRQPPRRAMPAHDDGRWPPNVALAADVADQLPDVARFFYVAKATTTERNAGLSDLPLLDVHRYGPGVGAAGGGETGGVAERNPHPTVKPIDLMRWLVRLICPAGGVVLDPFMGSGTTGIACHLEARRFVGIEAEAEYVDLAARRLAWWERVAPGTPTSSALTAGQARDERAARGQMELEVLA